MATSQFTLLASSNVGAPQLYGSTGSLITVLDYCLITQSRWLKPLPNSSSLGRDILGCYKQPSGSGCTLFINDNAPTATPGSKEAYAVGWETLTTMSAPCGTGSGQFPYFGQIQINGHITVCKSALPDNITPRAWVMYVDAYTFYFFIASGDAIGKYQSLFFGDIYSDSQTDNYKCQIQGKLADNQPTVAGGDFNDSITILETGISGINQGASGFIQRNLSGRSPSQWITKLGDYTKAITTTPTSITSYTPMAGGLPLPTLTNTLFMTPLLVWEPNTTTLRGRMRGMYHICHPLTSFVDGQIFSGSNDYAGKIFQIVKQGWNGGMWCIETSNQVETN